MIALSISCSYALSLRVLTAAAGLHSVELPSRWTRRVPYGQLWNVGPAQRPQQAVLDDVLTPTDLMVVPDEVVWTKNYHGHSWTTPQAAWPGATRVSLFAEEVPDQSCTASAAGGS